MTEKEKMLSGQLYSPINEELENDRNRAKDLTFDFNNLRPSQSQEKEALLKQLFGETGEHVWVEQPFHCDYGYNISVGEHFYANHNCVILDCAKVTIGHHVFLAPNVGIYTATHPLDAETRNQFLESAKPVTIGDNVWIGGGVTIVPGVTIGDNTVIGAGSVVVKDIPSNVLAVGNPCKPVRTITPEEKKQLEK